MKGFISVIGYIMVQLLKAAAYALIVVLIYVAGLSFLAYYTDRLVVPQGVLNEQAKKQSTYPTTGTECFQACVRTSDRGFECQGPCIDP